MAAYGSTNWQFEDLTGKFAGVDDCRRHIADLAVVEVAEAATVEEQRLEGLALVHVGAEGPSVYKRTLRRANFGLWELISAFLAGHGRAGPVCCVQ